MTIRLAIGLGFQRGIAPETLEAAVQQALDRLGGVGFEVACLATHARKSAEPALLALAEARGWRIQSLAPDRLASLDVPHPSVRANQEVGTPSVAEAAAMLAASSCELLVEKQVHRGADGKSVTVAIAGLASAP